MLDISHCQVGCDKFPEENVWARSSMDLSARVWPGSSGTDAPQKRKNKRMCGSHVRKSKEVPFVICRTG